MNEATGTGVNEAGAGIFVAPLVEANPAITREHFERAVKAMRKQRAEREHARAAGCVRAGMRIDSWDGMIEDPDVVCRLLVREESTRRGVILDVYDDVLVATPQGALRPVVEVRAPGPRCEEPEEVRAKLARLGALSPAAPEHGTCPDCSAPMRLSSGLGERVCDACCRRPGYTSPDWSPPAAWWRRWRAPLALVAVEVAQLAAFAWALLR